MSTLKSFGSRPLVVLLLLGALVAIVGLATGSLGLVVIGVIVAIVAALGEGLTDLELELFGAKATLKREAVEKAARELAVREGADPARAEKRAEQLATALVPPRGTRIVVSETGGASAVLQGGAKIRAQVTRGEAPDEALAREAAKLGFYLCDRCGFHLPDHVADVQEGQPCPHCGHGWLEHFGGAENPQGRLRSFDRGDDRA